MIIIGVSMLLKVCSFICYKDYCNGQLYKIFIIYVLGFYYMQISLIFGNFQHVGMENSHQSSINPISCTLDSVFPFLSFVFFLVAQHK
jgi:hypothetical protein